MEITNVSLVSPFIRLLIMISYYTHRKKNDIPTEFTFFGVNELINMALNF